MLHPYFATCAVSYLQTLTVLLFQLLFVSELRFVVIVTCVSELFRNIPVKRTLSETVTIFEITLNNPRLSFGSSSEVGPSPTALPFGLKVSLIYIAG